MEKAESLTYGNSSSYDLIRKELIVCDIGYVSCDNRSHAVILKEFVNFKINFRTSNTCMQQPLHPFKRNK